MTGQPGHESQVALIDLAPLLNPRRRRHSGRRCDRGCTRGCGCSRWPRTRRSPALPAVAARHGEHGGSGHGGEDVGCCTKVGERMGHGATFCAISPSPESSLPLQMPRRPLRKRLASPLIRLDGAAVAVLEPPHRIGPRVARSAVNWLGWLSSPGTTRLAMRRAVSVSQQREGPGKEVGTAEVARLEREMQARGTGRRDRVAPRHTRVDLGADAKLGDGQGLDAGT
jgi:hypothetical protein